MEAAVELFAKKGRDGTSIDEICKVSGVNCRMIYHYFGSKNGLYMAMLESVYGRLHEIAMNVDADSPLLADYLETLTERYFRFLQTNPEFVAILRWENASGAKGIHQLDLNNFRNQHLGAASRGLDGQHEAGQQKEGKHEQGPISEKSLFIILTCCSLCGYFFSNQASMSHVFGVQLDSSEFSERWLTHIKQVMLTSFCD